MANGDLSFEQTVSTIIRRHGERYSAPSRLALRIGDALETTMRLRPRAVPFRVVTLRRQLALAASLLLAVALSSGTTWYIAASDREGGLAEQVVASHARSMLAEHLTDVASSDQHAVKPWLGSRLDLSPPVVDLADKGFPLLGARLDYLDQRQVAALVYKRGLHFINLFVWPEEKSAMAVSMPASLRGYNLHRWSSGGFTFYAVSDAEPRQLDKLEKWIRAATQSQTSDLGSFSRPKIYVDLSRRTLAPLAFELHLIAPSPAKE